MWVQDLVLPGTNVMAEVSMEVANNFIKKCREFSLYHPKMEQRNTTNLIQEKPILNQNVNVFDLIDKKLTDMRQASFSQSRQHVESDIVSTLTKYIQWLHPLLEITKIGSSHYGIKGQKTNLNILIKTSKF